jgi:hypothetical protein
MRRRQAGAGALSPSTDVVTPWDEPDWAQQTAAWLGEHLTDPGPIKINRTRSWSLIGTTTSSDDRYWLKQVARPIGHEPALTFALERLIPRYLPEVVAAGGDRLLTRHVPRRLDLEAKGGLGPLWERVVGRYAELQIELAPFAADLPAPDGSPEAIVRRFGQRAEPIVAALGDSVPLTVVHLSVTGKNVCIRDSEPVFIDWAAGAFGHPFCGLAKTIRVFVRHHGVRPGAAVLRRLRDAYLEPWTDFAPARELRRVFAAAYALGALCRAAAKERVLDFLPEDIRADYAHGMAAQLEAFENALSSPGVLGA